MKRKEVIHTERKPLCSPVTRCVPVPQLTAHGIVVQQPSCRPAVTSILHLASQDLALPGYGPGIPYACSTYACCPLKPQEQTACAICFLLAHICRLALHFCPVASAFDSMRIADVFHGSIRAPKRTQGRCSGFKSQANSPTKSARCRSLHSASYEVICIRSTQIQLASH